MNRMLLLLTLLNFRLTYNLQALHYLLYCINKYETHVDDNRRLFIILLTKTTAA